ncbi:MAG: malate synthase G, partial [Actinomycetota bacterium]|nr:malate synthase G [Actinomycetota bacterium]
MNEPKVVKGTMEVDATLFDFVNDSLLAGSNRNSDHFWSNLENFLSDFSPRVKRLLRIRDDFQSQIDGWHVGNRGVPHDSEEYIDFLTGIGYVKERPESVQVQTANVDPEVASIAAPQLVVPVDNARYAINAANARWGSLYDALYGTDVISEDGGAGRSGPYNPVRGAKVIAFTRDLLDRHFALAEATHTDSTDYQIIGSEVVVSTSNGETGLKDPRQFIGYTGEPSSPDSIFLSKHGLHI